MNKILIVDDSESITNVLKASIAETGDYSVSVCHNFEQSRQLLETEADFFAAVLDLNLPDAPSGQVVDYVLQKGIPSIVLTGNLNDKVRENILSRPIVDYVAKNNMSEIRHVVSLINRLRKNPGIKILVVDDASSFRSYIASLLKIHGYQVLEAVDGIEAMTVLDKHKNEIMLVLSDYNMPNMDGLELTKTIRRDYSRSDLCIIAMSSQSTPMLSARFLKAGANDTITKPFLVEEFYSRINNHIEMLEYTHLIENIAIRDQLTGLHNRRYLFDAGNKLFTEAKKHHHSLAVTILDVDFFKNINDTYGHDVGDIALKNLALVLTNHTRKQDIVARFGGEEFCILASGSDNPDVFFEMLRRAIEAMEIPLQDGNKLKLTTSIGLAGELDETLELTLRSADMALYQAKEGGRNQVVISSEANLEGAVSTRLRCKKRPK